MLIHRILFLKGNLKMDNNYANQSIKCSVTQCKHHCCSQNNCSLNCIQVGTHECNPTQEQCTDCMSFEKK